MREVSDSSEVVRFISGLAALTTYFSGRGGSAAGAVATAALFALLVWLY